MVTKVDYDARAVHAARSVLLEITHLLGAYHKDIVLVGGWVPELLLPSKETPHVGSTDVDLALDHRRIEVEGYETTTVSNTILAASILWLMRSNRSCRLGS